MGNGNCIEIDIVGTIGQVTLNPNINTPPVAELWQVSICIIQDVTDETDSSGEECDDNDLVHPFVVITTPGGDPCEAFLETGIGCHPQGYVNVREPDDPFDTVCLREATLRIWVGGGPPSPPDFQVPGLASVTPGTC